MISFYDMFMLSFSFQVFAGQRVSNSVVAAASALVTSHRYLVYALCMPNILYLTLIPVM